MDRAAASPRQPAAASLPARGHAAETRRHHRHVRRRALRGHPHLRGPRLLLHRQPAAVVHRAARRARRAARAADADASRSSATCAAHEFFDELAGELERARATRASDPTCSSSRRTTRRCCGGSRRRAAATRCATRASRCSTASAPSARRSARFARAPTSSSTRRDLRRSELRQRDPRAVLRRIGARCTLAITVSSFGFKYGAAQSTPTSSWTCASCRTRTTIPSCAPLTGLDAPVRDFVLGTPETDGVPRRAGSRCSTTLVPGYVMRGQAPPRHRARLHRRDAPLASRSPRRPRRSCASCGYRVAVAPSRHRPRPGATGERRGRAAARSRSAAAPGCPPSSRCLLDARLRDDRGRHHGRRRRLVRRCCAASSACCRPATSATASWRWPTTRRPARARLPVPLPGRRGARRSRARQPHHRGARRHRRGLPRGDRGRRRATWQRAGACCPRRSTTSCSTAWTAPGGRIAGPGALAVEPDAARARAPRARRARRRTRRRSRRSRRPTSSSSGPGSLYTSLIPNFLVAGVAEALARVAGAARLRLQRREPARRDRRAGRRRPRRRARRPRARAAPSTSCSCTTPTRRCPALCDDVAGVEPVLRRRRAASRASRRSARGRRRRPRRPRATRSVTTRGAAAAALERVVA